MGTPEARRRAVAAHEKRLQVRGVQKVTARLEPETAAKLDALVKIHGSKQAAINHAIAMAADQSRA